MSGTHPLRIARAVKPTIKPLSHVNLKLLQTFLLVAESNSFRTAAEKSFRSPSAVSAQIRMLEEQLGVSLFHRTTRNVRLTAEGEQLLECAQRALLEVEAGLRKIQESADMRRGRVSLSCSPTVAETRLARVLAAFEKDYPGIEVSVRELTSSALFESVRKHEVDFGIGPSIETSEFSFEPLMEDPFFALVPKRFITTAKHSISLTTLTNMPLLLLNPATALRGMLDAALEEKHLTLTTRYEFAQAQTLISMASAGLGAAVLPKVALPRRIGSSMHVLRIVNPTLVRQVSVITVRGQKLSPASMRLVHLLKQLLPDPGERRDSRKTATLVDE
ncbi:MAG: LysR family transcriptional regulator [Cupriavidus sp.]|nr:LysR family transcriptional regulator [Cupriavidus sp.]QWE97155.1 LysR family transcriptional regulator [Cupriavidus sp. EM10]MCA3189154.1 LysR family transcriptional regulator [Cupriavidus sp.]MCA3198874.1 LysR family transcriptional regulator [Cupriavidus sp.]MCA3201618.1 LysR family transcriptional regulator [Cupriavidus sp.]